MITEVKSPDFYRLLNLKHDASQKDIDLAYQKLISKFDSSEGKSQPPDKPTLKEQIEMAQEAYDTLSNKEKREAYDAVVQVKKGAKPISSVRTNPIRFIGSKERAKNPNHQNVYQDFFGFLEKISK